MAKRVQKPRSSASSRRRTAIASAGSEGAFERIAHALERLAGGIPETPRFAAADAFSWHPDERRLAPVANVNRVEMSLLKGIDRVRDVLLENTERFARGLPANNALLWGARGMGKSSLVKAVHAQVNVAHTRRKGGNGPLKLIEIHREDIESLPDLMTLMREAHYRFIVFCDDLSFEAEDEFLQMVDGYVAHYRIAHPREKTHPEALEWATTRGARSGRVAWQYVQDLAGRLGVKLEERGRKINER